MLKLPPSPRTASRRSSGTRHQPTRQPVIEKYLENEFITRPRREVDQAQAPGSP